MIQKTRRFIVPSILALIILNSILYLIGQESSSSTSTSTTNHQRSPSSSNGLQFRAKSHYRCLDKQNIIGYWQRRSCIFYNVCYRRRQHSEQDAGQFEFYNGAGSSLERSADNNEKGRSRPVFFDKQEGPLYQFQPPDDETGVHKGFISLFRDANCDGSQFFFNPVVVEDQPSGAEIKYIPGFSALWPLATSAKDGSCGSGTRGSSSIETLESLLNIYLLTRRFLRIKESAAGDSLESIVGASAIRNSPVLFSYPGGPIANEVALKASWISSVLPLVTGEAPKSLEDLIPSSSPPSQSPKSNFLMSLFSNSEAGNQDRLICFEELMVPGSIRLISAANRLDDNPDEIPDDPFNEGKEPLLFELRASILKLWALDPNHVPGAMNKIRLVKSASNSAALVEEALERVDPTANLLPDLKASSGDPVSRESLQLVLEETTIVIILPTNKDAEQPPIDLFYLTFLPLDSVIILPSNINTGVNGAFYTPFLNLWPHIEKIYYPQQGDEEQQVSADQLATLLRMAIIKRANRRELQASKFNYPDVKK